MLWRDGPTDARRNDKRGSGTARLSARRRRVFSYSQGRSRMANHLTPEELSKELGIEQQEVIRVCVQEGVPIYHGKIDKYLFQAERQALLRAGARREREPPSDGVAFVFLGAFAPEPLLLRSCTSATLRRSASIRSITGVSATGSGRTSVSPASFASSIVFRSRRYSFSKSTG